MLLLLLPGVGLLLLLLLVLQLWHNLDEWCLLEVETTTIAPFVVGLVLVGFARGASQGVLPWRKVPSNLRLAILELLTVPNSSLALLAIEPFAKSAKVALATMELLLLLLLRAIIVLLLLPLLLLQLLLLLLLTTIMLWLLWWQTTNILLLLTSSAAAFLVKETTMLQGLLLLLLLLLLATKGLLLLLLLLLATIEIDETIITVSMLWLHGRTIGDWVALLHRLLLLLHMLLLHMLLLHLLLLLCRAMDALLVLHLLHGIDVVVVHCQCWMRLSRRLHERNALLALLGVVPW